ncbi:CMD domain-containing protein [Muricoccus radiodurans]|uniref:CMD domain-containing protein n=1 Tax=Muricoccus radiodurans TaxID=2231721 RepID=UPI003CFA6454
MSAEPEDLIESILGVTPDSPIGQLRRRRPEALRHAQGAYRELLMPEDPGTVPPAHRAALALRVALREGDDALADRYRALLAEDPEALMLAEDLSGAPVEGRLAALLRYADTVAAKPEAVTQETIDDLTALGLTPRDIVAVTQLTAFVPYQVRLLAGLRAMLQEDAA